MSDNKLSLLKVPTKLSAGDKVATVTLSWGGPGACPHRYAAGKRQLEEGFGIQVIEMEHTLRDSDWIKNNPKARADDLMEAFSRSDIKGIIATIGGDDSIRILPHLDLSIITKNPKIFMGYSDTTVTHLACLKAGLRSYYGPSIMAGFGENGGLFEYMKESVARTLFSAHPIGDIPVSDVWTDEFLDWFEPTNQNKKRNVLVNPGRRTLQGKSKVSGRLIGGCLEVLEFIKGTDFWPSPEHWNEAILFLETSEENPDPNMVRRWIRNLGVQGVLGRINGILLARPPRKSGDPDLYRYDEILLSVVRDEFGYNTLPILSQMDFGHTDPMFVIPYGAMAELNANSGGLSILETGVLE